MNNFGGLHQPTAPPGPGISLVHFELKLSVSLTINQNVPDPKLLILALKNWPAQFTGEFSFRNLWMTLAIICISDLKLTSVVGSKYLYRNSIMKGLGLKFKSVTPFEIGMEHHWSQTMRIMINGVCTCWSFDGVIEPTMIPYPPRPALPGLRNLLEAFWISTDEDEGHLVIVL